MNYCVSTKEKNYPEGGISALIGVFGNIEVAEWIKNFVQNKFNILGTIDIEETTSPVTDNGNVGIFLDRQKGK